MKLYETYTLLVKLIGSHRIIYGLLQLTCCSYVVCLITYRDKVSKCDVFFLLTNKILESETFRHFVAHDDDKMKNEYLVFCCGLGNKRKLLKIDELGVSKSLW